MFEVGKFYTNGKRKCCECLCVGNTYAFMRDTLNKDNDEFPVPIAATSWSETGKRITKSYWVLHLKSGHLTYENDPRMAWWFNKDNYISLIKHTDTFEEGQGL